MQDDKFDAIIVGGGLAGSVCGYLLAKEGLEVLIIEKGNFAGSKNMTGGRLYAHSIEKIFPNFADEAPIERVVTHEKISFLDKTSCITIDYSAKKSEQNLERSYIILRSKFDQWLAQKAEEAGANIITGIRVDDTIVRDGKVCGVKAGDEEMESNVVVLADGVNSILAEKLGLNTKVTPHNCAVGVKEIISLSKQKINDRFNCLDDEGAAWLFAGYPSDGHMGGGFIYTNDDSISLGVVFGLHNIQNSQKSIPQMLEDFKNHKNIKPLLEGGEQVEYSAHVVPEGGINMMPEIVHDGVLVVGDAAGLCLNVGYTVRGMDLAIGSGEIAANAILKAKKQDDFTKVGLQSYKDGLNNSFIIKDMELYKNLPSFLDNPRVFNEYPNLLSSIFKDIFTINGPSKPIRKKILPHIKKIGFINLFKDLYKGVKSL